MKLLHKKVISKYLNNGMYFYNFDFTQLSSNNVEYDHFKNLEYKKNYRYYLRKILKKVLKINIKGKSKIFDGDTVLIPSSKYGLKFFSKNEVLTLFNNKNNLDLYLKNKNIISSFYKTPQTIRVNDNYVIEEKIPSINYDKKNILKLVIRMYIENNCKKNIKIKYFKSKIQKRNVLFNEFYTKIEYLDEYPTAIQHCDLWFSNVLLSKDHKIYIIDYENANTNYFLYDFFTYIYNEALLFNNYELLKEYFIGNFDDVLKEYFNIFNLKYEASKKNKYFKIFLNVLIEKKFSKYCENIYDKEIKKMIKIYSEIAEGV